MKTLIVLLTILCITASAQDEATYRLINVDPGPVVTVEVKEPKASSGVDPFDTSSGKDKRKGFMPSPGKQEYRLRLVTVDISSGVKPVQAKPAAQYIKTLLAGKTIKIASKSGGTVGITYIYIVEDGAWLDEKLKAWSVDNSELGSDLASAISQKIEPKSYRLNIDFAGLYLGCDKQTALNFMGRCKLKEKGDREGRFYYSYIGNPSLPSARETHVTFLNGILVYIRIDFEKKSQGDTYELIKSNLETKYGKLQGHWPECSRNTSGMNLRLEQGYGSLIHAEATHIALQQEYEKSKNTAAAAAIGKF